MDYQKAISDGHSPEEVMGELARRGVQMNYKQALADGHDPMEVLKEMGAREASATSAPKPAEKPKGKSVADYAEMFGRKIGVVSPFGPDATGKIFRKGGEGIDYIKDKPKEAVRMGMQGVGATAGALLAAPGVVTSGAGGALGYVLGNKLADMTIGDRPATESPLAKMTGTTNPLGAQALQILGDVGVGAGYELLGGGMNAAARGVGHAVDIGAILRQKGFKNAAADFMEKQAVKQAGKRIARTRTTSPDALDQINKNAAANAEVEKAIPNLRLNLGEKGGDPNLLSMARQVGKMPGVGTALQNESVMAQNKALSDYTEAQIIGKGKPDAWLDSLRSEQKRLAGQTESAVQGAETEAGKIQGVSEDMAGKALREGAVSRRAASSAKAKKLYDAVPENIELDSAPLYAKVKEILGDYDYATQRLSATPVSAARRVQGAMEPEPVISPILDSTGKPITQQGVLDAKGNPVHPEKLTLKQYNDFRSQVGTDQRRAYEQGNYELAYKLGKLKSGVNESLAQAAETGQGEGIQALKDATDYWRTEHVPNYRQGATSDVLETDRSGAFKVVYSSVGGQYFKPGKGAIEGAKDFKRTFGDDAEAKVAFKVYPSQSLLKTARDPSTGELVPKKVMNWLYQHNTALEQHGLKSEFGSLTKALKIADAAKGAEKAFNKSSLATALDVDPDRAIETALFQGAGRKQSITRLQELARLARKDSSGAALDGLRAAIGDHFQRATETTAKDLAGGNMSSYAKIDKFVKEFMPALEQS